MPITNCDNMSKKAWYLKWTDLTLRKKSPIFPLNSTKRTNKFKNLLRKLRKLDKKTKAQSSIILQAMGQKPLHMNT